jgi:hypothetical protein
MKKKVTVSGERINDVFVGEEDEVFEYLTNIKNLQMSMVGEKQLLAITQAELKVSDFKQFADIGLSIKITDAT